MNADRKKLFAALGLLCLCLAFAAAAKKLYAPAGYGPFFEVEASAYSPENFILLIDSASCGREAAKPASGRLITLDNVQAFFAEPGQNAQTILSRIPPDYEGDFKEKSLITLFAEAGYTTFYINAEAGAQASAEAQNAAKGPAAVLGDILSGEGRKFAAAEPFEGEKALAGIINLIENSAKPSLLLAAGAKACPKADCPSQHSSYITLYANKAYTALPGSAEKLNNFEAFKDAPLTLQYVFDTAASLAGLHYATADGLKDITRVKPRALESEAPSFCKI